MALADDKWGGGPMSGHVEIDETFVGGRRKAGEPDNKTVVFGMLQRDGRLLAAPIPDVTTYTAAESHSYARTRNIIKSDGTKWKREVLIEEIKRQLGDAADGNCPQCAHFRESKWRQALKVKSALT
jgi:hypothetical protein